MGVFCDVKGLCINSRLSSKINAFIEVSAALSLIAHVVVCQGLECRGNRMALRVLLQLLYSSISSLLDCTP